MTELDLIKYIVQAGFAGIAVILVLLLWRFVTGTQSSDKAQFGIMERLITIMTDKFADINASNQRHQEELLAKMQAQFAEALNVLVQNVTQHMTPAMQRREAKYEAIHADVKVVPKETQRLLQNDFAGQVETIRMAFEHTLAETEKRIVESLSPQAEEAQKAVHQALESMKADLGSALAQLKDIHETLDRMEQSSAITAKDSADKPAPAVTETPTERAGEGMPVKPEEQEKENV